MTPMCTYWKAEQNKSLEKLRQRQGHSLVVSITNMAIQAERQRGKGLKKKEISTADKKLIRKAIPESDKCTLPDVQRF